MMTGASGESLKNLGESRRQPDLILEGSDTRLSRLEDRYYTTYLSRLAMEKRLAARSRSWNAALVALTTAGSFAGVSLLADGDIYGPKGGLLITLFGLLALVASLVVTNAQYGVRARAAAENYRAVQQISLVAERLHAEARRGAEVKERLTALEAQYDELLNHAENHTLADYASAVGILRASGLALTPATTRLESNRRRLKVLSVACARGVSALASFSPWLFIIISAAFILPIVVWFVDG